MTEPNRSAKPLIIASQMNASANQTLRERLAQDPFPGAANAQVVEIKPWAAPHDLPTDAQVLIARPMPKDLKNPAPEDWPRGLQWVQLMGIGLDGYPRWLLETEGLPACVARETSSNVIAEYVIGMIFAAAKDLPNLWIHEAAKWKLRPTASVAGSTLGIYGWGGIGQAVARRAVALGQKVKVLRRSDAPVTLDGTAHPDITRAASLEDLLQSSDHLLLAAPSTADTRHIINRESLRLAKPGLHLINVARGTLVDQDALIEALDAGTLSRASLDVTTPEPLPEGHALYTHPKAFITAHTCSVSPETEQGVVDLFLRNAAHHAQGEPFEHVFDSQRGY